MAYSIRFPKVKERYKGDRRRVRHTVDNAGLHGARFCACNMVRGALLYRDEAASLTTTKFSYLSAERIAVRQRIARLGMRLDALWARVFAGHIDQSDPRIDAAMTERSRLVDGEYRTPTTDGYPEFRVDGRLKQPGKTPLIKG